MEATQMRSAREASQATVNSLSDAIQVDAPRFFVQFGWDVLRVDTSAISNKYLLRGEITPCKSYAQLAPLVEIREGELIPGSESGDRDGRTIYGKYWRRAHFEAERLIENEQANDRKQGIFEIPALSGLNSVIYDRVDLNTIFYAPYTLANLPATNKELIAHLETRVAEIERDGVDGVPPQFQGVIVEAGKQLIQAAKSNDRIQTQRLEFTHTCMKLPPSDPSGLWKREYDLVDEEMLARTGTPRVHAADITTAKALDKLTDRNDNSGLLELAAALREQNALQLEVIKTLLTERETAKPARTRSKVKDEE